MLDSSEVARHKPVLVDEVIDGLAIVEGGTYIDGTTGSAGHSELIVERVGTSGRLLCLDRDSDAITRATARLAQWQEQCTIVQGSFADMVTIAGEHGIKNVDGVLLDLGVSSEQLGTPGRGFSFGKDGPLDMRMDSSQATTAADLVNGLSESELARIISSFGEERASRRIAHALAAERRAEPIESTARLAEIVGRAKRGRRGRIHPATQTFQAIRMVVNKELDALRQGLEAGLEMLRVGGRMAVISFHSLEDRLVKSSFREHAGYRESLQQGGSVWHRKEPAVSLVRKKPVTASPEEIAANARSRTAKLRIAQRIEERD